MGATLLSTFVRKPDQVISHTEHVENEVDHLVLECIKRMFHLHNGEVGKLKWCESEACWIVTSFSRYCHFIEREHTSNNQYIVIQDGKAWQKCHSSDCANKKSDPLTIPENIMLLLIQMRM